MCLAGIMFCEASNRDEVNTMGVSPRGFPRGSREIQNGRWAFLLVHTWSLPSQAEPLGLPLLSGPSSLPLSGQLTNGVGKLGVVAAYVDPTDTRPAFTYWYAWVRNNEKGASHPKYCWRLCQKTTIVFKFCIFTSKNENAAFYPRLY